MHMGIKESHQENRVWLYVIWYHDTCSLYGMSLPYTFLLSHTSPTFDPFPFSLSFLRTVAFTPGKPFLPYEQLLAVQPPASCTLLPEPYQHLMTSQQVMMTKHFTHSISISQLYKSNAPYLG